MQKDICRGYIVEVVGIESLNGMKGYITSTDSHSAVVELTDGSIHNLLKENYKILNGDTEIEYGEDETMKQAKERYIKGYIGMPENYMRSWTEVDIQKVIDRLKIIDMRNKNLVKLTDYLLASELERTVGGIMWLRRRLFQKETAKVSLTELIKQLKEKEGLI